MKREGPFENLRFVSETMQQGVGLISLDILGFEVY